ncbi:MAG: DUF115 domain-containing protein, partial [Clostridiales bacterium]|nr:DUF115 domain-containing protein [Clostridiales bacterium]
LEEKKEQEFEIVKKGAEFVLKVKNDKGRMLQYTSVDVENEVKRLTKHLDYTVNRSFFLIIGIGVGSVLKEICGKINKKSVILVVERDIYLFKAILSKIDLTVEIAGGQILFVFGNQKDDEFVTRFSRCVAGCLFNINSVQPVILSVKDLNYIKFANEVLTLLYKEKSVAFFKLGNDIPDTLVGLRNRLNNLEHYAVNPGLNDIKNKFENAYKNKPAIVVASGPSLDKNIDILKKAKGKALILACDGSMDSLLKRDIVPEVVGSVERVLITYEKFYEGKNFPSETVLVAPAVVNPKIPNTFTNKTVSMFKAGEMHGEWCNELLLNKGTAWSGLSVAHLMYGIAYELGCNPIILIGQDLAYSDKGISHVSEAAVKEEVNLDNVEVFVDGINGEKIPSTFIWQMFLKMYEERIEKDGDSVTVIDATEGGALIRGTEISTLAECVEKYCSDEIESFRTLVDKINISGDFVKNALLNAQSDIIKKIKDFNQLRGRVVKHIKMNEKAKRKSRVDIRNQADLDYIYDCIESVETDVVKYILKNTFMSLVFQYPITVAATRIGFLETKYTYETIRSNLEIQRELLETVEEFTLKTMKILYEGLEKVKSIIEKRGIESQYKETNMKWVEKYIQFELDLSSRE